MTNSIPWSYVYLPSTLGIRPTAWRQAIIAFDKIIVDCNNKEIDRLTSFSRLERWEKALEEGRVKIVEPDLSGDLRQIPGTHDTHEETDGESDFVYVSSYNIKGAFNYNEKALKSLQRSLVSKNLCLFFLLS